MARSTVQNLEIRKAILLNPLRFRDRDIFKHSLAPLLTRSQSSLMFPFCSSPESRGVSRSSLTRAGMRWTLRCRSTSGTLRVRRNRVVLAPQRSGVKLPTMLAHRGGDGGKRDGSPRSNCVEVDRRAAGLKAGAGRATAFGG